MWEFLGQVLEKGGVVAVIQVLVLIGVALFIKWLWNEQRRLHHTIVELQATHAEQIAEVQDKLNELQERRVAEAKNVTKEVIEHVSQIDRSLEKLESSLDVLIEFSGRR
jgi:ubiquinone biosynthesis protein UbiJ